MKKKISSLVLYLVLGVVVLGLVLCAIIKINFKPELQVPIANSVGQIQISANNGTSKNEANKESIDVEKFNNKFNSSFELSILYSLFSGKIGNSMKLEKQTTVPSVTGYKVEFIYTEDAVLVINGKEQTIATNSTTPIKYNRVVFGVEEGKGLKGINFYYYINGEKEYYKVTTIGNFDSLYNYISTLSMFGE